MIRMARAAGFVTYSAHGACAALDVVAAAGHLRRRAAGDDPRLSTRRTSMCQIDPGPRDTAKSRSCSLKQL
jgi:hypothetical protein